MAAPDETYEPVEGCCNACRHYDPTAFGKANYGHCRRYPPVAVETSGGLPRGGLAGGGLRRQLRRVRPGLTA